MASQRVGQIQAVHTNKPLSFPECSQTILRESALAEKQPSCPVGLTLTLAIEGKQVARVRLCILPTRFEEIGFVRQGKTSVDLLTNKPKWTTCRHSECIKHMLEKMLERIAPFLRR